MRTLLLLFLLLLTPTWAQSWELLEPAMPVKGKSGEAVLFRVRGVAGQNPYLKISGQTEIFRLVELEPGNYQAELFIPRSGRKAVFLMEAKSSFRERLGTLAQTDSCGVFRPQSETVTRQGPHPDYDRLTPLYAGQTVGLDGARGNWYRCKGSGTWVDGRKAPIGKAEQESTIPPNRLKRILVTEDQNGDALLTLNMTRCPEVQVTSSGNSLRFLLQDTLQTNFDVRRPTKVAEFLGPIVLNPRAQQRAVLIELTRGANAGYLIEPTESPGKLTIRVRKPLPRSLNGLRVTVDAGHGGPEDPGTVGHLGLAEKALNLRVAKALAEQLRSKGAVVTMTRTIDTSVATGRSADTGGELQSRVDHSIEKDSQLFLSVHHNARGNIEEGKRYHGTDIYWYHPSSQALARNLADPIADSIGEKTRSFRWRSFYVIRQTYTPSVLMEFQYLSNPVLEKSVLSQPDYADKAARGVVNGLLRYLKEVGK